MVVLLKSYGHPCAHSAVLFAAQDDPLLQNANAPLFAWFQVGSPYTLASSRVRTDLVDALRSQAFIILEVLFQVPVFFLGVRGLWKRESPLTLRLGGLTLCTAD